MTQALTLYPTASTALFTPVEHITREQKERLKDAVLLWRDTIAPQTGRSRYITDRDYLMIEWLWHTGMRISDAMAIRITDIHTETETVRFVVKKRSRAKLFIHTITLSKEMLFDVFRYMDRWQIVFGDILFRATGKKDKGMSRQNAGKRIKLYWQIAGLPPLSPKMFRHGCAMNLLNQGVPSVEIGFRLAHSNTQVTESVYARMSPDVERRMLEGITW